MIQHCTTIITLYCVLCRAWNGILIDNTSGGAQLVLPNQTPHVVNVNFTLPHLIHGVAVTHTDGNCYFIGGYTSTSTSSVAAVKRFNPITNVTNSAGTMQVGRSYFGATVVGGTIIVCGGERK